MNIFSFFHHVISYTRLGPSHCPSNSKSHVKDNVGKICSRNETEICKLLNYLMEKFVSFIVLNLLFIQIKNSKRQTKVLSICLETCWKRSGDMSASEYVIMNNFRKGKKISKNLQDFRRIGCLSKWTSVCTRTISLSLDLLFAGLQFKYIYSSNYTSSYNRGESNKTDCASFDGNVCCIRSVCFPEIKINTYFGTRCLRKPLAHEAAFIDLTVRDYKTTSQHAQCGPLL